MKVDLFAMPTIHAASWEERAALRPIGRNSERYQMMLDELRDLAVHADQLGVDAFSVTEHHFHTEGGEAMPNSLMLFADIAARTKRIMMLPMSIVLTTHDPIRVAEDIALLDQLTKGRVGVGLARGYQKRWVQVLSQGGATALPDQQINPTEMDALNREVFDEYYEVMIKAWTEDAFDYDGKHYQVPYPHDEGIHGYAGVDWTRTFGSDGEVDEDGVIRKIGVIPRPYQVPHPPVFVPFTASPATMISAAHRGATPFLFTSKPADFARWAEFYRDEAAKAGRQLGLGESFGANRSITIGDTFEEAFELAVKTTGYEYHNYFNRFGFAEAFRTDADDPNKPVTLKDEVEVTKRMIEIGSQLCGTVDDIKRKLEDLHRCYADGELEWISWNFFYQGTSSREVQERQLELFMTEVMPEFRSASDSAPAEAHAPAASAPV